MGHKNVLSHTRTTCSECLLDILISGAVAPHFFLMNNNLPPMVGVQNRNLRTVQGFSDHCLTRCWEVRFHLNLDHSFRPFGPPSQSHSSLLLSSPPFFLSSFSSSLELFLAANACNEAISWKNVTSQKVILKMRASLWEIIVSSRKWVAYDRLDSFITGEIDYR